jgi:hypothetical protein
VNIILSIILLDLLGEYITLAIEYLYSWTKTLYLRAFNYLIAKDKLCTFKSEMLPIVGTFFTGKEVINQLFKS